MRRGRRKQSNVGDAQRTEACHSCGTPHVLSNIKFCKDCRELLCQKCISQAHNYHTTSDTGSIATETKKNVLAFTSSKNTQDKIGSIQQIENLAKKFRDELLALETDQIDGIKRHIAKLHQHVDQIGDILIQNVTCNMTEEQKRLSKLEKESKKMCTTISSLLDTAKQIAKERDDIIVVNRGMSICDELKDALNTELTSPTRDPAFDVKYVPGILDSAVLQVMCGQVAVPIPLQESPKVAVPVPTGGATLKVMRLTNKLYVENSNADICVVTGDTAWVGVCGGKLSEVERTGTLTRTVNVTNTGNRCSGITKMDDGWLVAVHEDRKIYYLSRECHLSTWAKTTFVPWGMTAVSTDRVLVCGNTAGLYIVTRRGEQQVDLGVKFERIVCVATNKHGDVAVSDYDRHQVVIMDAQYKHLCCYKGVTPYTETSTLEGITSDGDIFIVCDPYNHRLHFIDRNGICLSVYNTTRDCPVERPWKAHMTPDSRLWVKFEDGKSVCVYDIV